LVDHPAFPCPSCGGRVYVTAMRCPHCGADLPPEFPAPEGWTRDARGRLCIRFGATLEIRVEPGRTIIVQRDLRDPP